MVKSIFVFVFGVVCERIHLDDGPLNALQSNLVVMTLSDTGPATASLLSRRPTPISWFSATSLGPEYRKVSPVASCLSEVCPSRFALSNDC